MNFKSFLIGVLAGIILTLVFILYRTSTEQQSDPIHYLEEPLSYENKAYTKFQVFQILDSAALAKEAITPVDDYALYEGNTVLFLGENFYTGQIITIENPQRIGSYDCEDSFGEPITVPVIDVRMGQ